MTSLVLLGYVSPRCTWTPLSGASRLLAEDVSRESIVVLEEGSPRRAVRIGAPTEPVAPAMRTLWMAEGIMKIDVRERRNGCGIRKAFRLLRSQVDGFHLKTHALRSLYCWCAFRGPVRLHRSSRQHCSKQYCHLDTAVSTKLSTICLSDPDSHIEKRIKRPSGLHL